MSGLTLEKALSELSDTTISDNRRIALNRYVHLSIEKLFFLLCQTNDDLSVIEKQVHMLGPEYTQKSLLNGRVIFEGMNGERIFNEHKTLVNRLQERNIKVSELLKLLEEIKGQRRFWFTTLDAIQSESVLTAPIWQVATEDSLRVLIEPPEKG